MPQEAAASPQKPGMLCGREHTCPGTDPNALWTPLQPIRTTLVLLPQVRRARHLTD